LLFGNALEAKTILNTTEIRLLFLDIHLPVLDGINFFSTLKSPPEVIFTTAYKEYAVDAFNLDACDYLVKSFLLERFIIALGKAVTRINTKAKPYDPVQDPSIDDSFFIRTEEKMYNIKYDKLIYAEANGNYTKLTTDTGVLIPNITLSGIEKLLPATHFILVHRSFIINRSQITHIEGNRVFIGKHEIPIGMNHRDVLSNHWVCEYLLNPDFVISGRRILKTPTLRFMQMHEFHTPYCQQKSDAGKSVNISGLIKNIGQ